MKDEKINVIYDGRKKSFSLSCVRTPMDVVEKLNLYIDDILIVKDGRPIPCDEKLGSGDTIYLIHVASGG